jgi:hypothetical protein
MKILEPEYVSVFNSALSKLTGFTRREYAAELCELFFDGSASKMERYLNVSRKMVELGMHERRTGIQCIELFSKRGAKKKR